MLYVNPLETSVASRTATGPEAKKAQEKVALQELEHLFLFTLLQEMRKTVPLAKDTEKSQEKQIYNEMLDDALSGVMAQSGQLGIAKQMEKQMRTNEAQQRLPLRRESKMPI